MDKNSIIGLVVIVDIDTGEILDADCTLATQLACKYVNKILVGQSFDHGSDQVIRILDQAYQGSAKKAIITAIRIIYDKYRSYKDGSTAVTE